MKNTASIFSLFLFRKANALILLLLLLLLSSFKEKELTWVAIGDSITYLNDHPDETGNRVSKGYLTRVTEQLPNLRYITRDITGGHPAE